MLDALHKVLDLQAKTIGMWDSPDALPSNAKSHRTIEELDLIQGLHDAEEAGDLEAKYVLSSVEALDAYLAKFH